MYALRHVLFLPALLMAVPAAGEPRVANGFVLESDVIDVAEIEAGGPPRDGIPALTHPPAIPLSEARYEDDEVVLGVEVGGEPRAYPVAILTWHELVNDTVGGEPILVSYCPLCGTGIVYHREVGDRIRTFGVSGLLYRSDLLMYDRQDESLWSQIAAHAVTGPAAGMRLRMLRSGMYRLADWREAHPESTILSPETGERRPYGRSPYGDYATREDLLFSAPADPRYHPKMPTVGLRVPGGDAARAYPAAELVSAGGAVQERFAGRDVRVAYDPERQVFDVEAPEALEVIEGFWFAWSAFHPETSVFVAPRSADGD